MTEQWDKHKIIIEQNLSFGVQALFYSKVH